MGWPTSTACLSLTGAGASAAGAASAFLPPFFFGMGVAFSQFQNKAAAAT